MSMMSEQPRRGPARFQQDDSGDGRRSVLQALGAGLALLVLTVGVPGALVWQGGLSSLPTSLPTRNDLTSEIGVGQLVTILVVVTLLAWLQFTICVVVELRSALAGVGLPGRVPLSGPMQRFARVLVGSVLVATTAVGPAAATTSDAHADQVAPATEQVVEADAESAGGPDRTDGATPAPSGDVGEVVYHLGDEVLDEEDAELLVGHKVYRVQPPEGRYHDNLWDIAERHLGDGRRYKEIFELNRGRTQPDGHELSLARLIYPHWLLIMPDDATGLDRVTAEAVEQPARADAGQAGVTGDGATADARFVPEPPQARSGLATEAAANGGGVAETAGHGLPPGGEHAAHDAVARSQDWSELVTAGLLCAGLLAAIATVRRRRRTPEPEPDEVETEVALRVAADPDRAFRLDRALRSLTASERRLPSVYSVLVDDDGIELRLAPAIPEAPEPWEARDDGQRWWLPADAEPAASQQDGIASFAGRQRGAAPYPGLVSLGRDHDGRDVLIDLEAASGPIAVIGDPTVAFEVVTAMAVELATNTWSDRMRVTGVGLPVVLSELGSDRYKSVDAATDAVRRVAAKRSGTHGADVLTGRIRWPGNDQFEPEYVVLGAVPDENVTGELRELTAGGRAPVGVLSAGEFPGARWRLEVDSAGTLHVPALGVTVTANRMTARTAALAAALVSPAHLDPADGHEGPLPEAWLTEFRPEVPPPAVEIDTAALATAPVRVFILGAPEVQAVGPVSEERRELATEMVVYLAMHRDGAHPNVLAAALWPGGVTADVRDNTVERVREWLGTDPEGSPYLLATPDGRLKLSDDVALDWDAVTTLLRRSREVASPADEADLLRRALRVARGPAIALRPRGRYSWIARARLESTVSDALVDASHRLSVLTTEKGDPGMGVAAARAGIRVRPGEQVLWRDLMRAEHARVGHEGVVAATGNLVDELAALGVPELEPETVALLDELDPEHSLRVAAAEQAS